MKAGINKRIINILGCVIALVVLCIIAINLYYIDSLENQIRERDELIRSLSFRSELVDGYFDVKVDSTRNITSYILKDSKKTKIIETHSEHIKTTIEKYDDELISNYNRLVDEYNSISVENSKNKTIIKEQKVALELIEKNYQIKYRVSVDSIYARTVLFNTEKVDSALLLLPYYRDKIKKFDDKTWTISVQK